MNTKRIKLGCYVISITMAIIANLPPLLFITFNSVYKISYSLLGMLVLINFVSQLSMDLAFSFFSYKFNIHKTVKLIPVITVVGMLIFVISPLIMREYVYWGLAVGTTLFSAASGFAEVLMSPLVAAIPSKNPEREMSILHSMYAWGTLGVVVLSTVFLFLFGRENWQWLMALWMIVPVWGFCIFFGQRLPELKTPERFSGAIGMLKNKTLWLCVLGIFCGGAAECTMSQWVSGYAEMALGIPKIYGDIFGIAFFAVMLGIGRTAYAKYGKNITSVLFLGSAGAVLCYIMATLSGNPITGLIACAFTGLCTSMLWPGSLILVEEKLPNCGVFAYALMAAGGDLGASIGPQLVGVITDFGAQNARIVEMAEKLMLAPEQLGMKLGMLTISIFPLVGAAVFFKFRISKRRVKNEGI